MGSRRDKPFRRIDLKLGNETIELPGLPLRIVVIGPFVPREPYGYARGPRPQRPLAITRATFDDTVAKIGPVLRLWARDRVTGHEAGLECELRFSALRDFRPEAVAQSVPLLKQLVELRAALDEFRAKKIGPEELRRRSGFLPPALPLAESVRRATEPPAPGRTSLPVQPQPPAKEGSDRLFDLLDIGGEAEPPTEASSMLDALLRGGGGTGPDARQVVLAQAEIDRVLSEQLGEIFSQDDFRSLESSWRGLKFLLDRLDREAPIEVELISSERDDLLSTLDLLIEESGAAGALERPVSLIVVDFLFGHTAPEIEILAGLAERGSILHAPVVTGAGFEFLDTGAAERFEGAGSVAPLFEQPEFIKWRGLRRQEPARWLALAFNGVLLRPDYGQGEQEVQGFTIDPGRFVTRDRHRCWGNPAFALATLAAASFADTGWPTEVIGDIEDLPVRLWEGREGEQAAFSLQIKIRRGGAEELAAEGLAPLIGDLDRDRARISVAPTVRVPDFFQEPAVREQARRQTTLAFQLFAGRVVQVAMLLEHHLSGRLQDEITYGYQRVFQEMLALVGPVAPEAVEVQMIPGSGERAGKNELQLRVRWPGSPALSPAGYIELGWTLS